MKSCRSVLAENPGQVDQRWPVNKYRHADMANNTTQPTEPRSRLLTLVQNGQYVSLDDDHLRLLGDLTGRRLVASNDELHGYNVSPVRHSLLRTPDPARIPNAGCIPMLTFLARQRGIDLRVQASPTICTLPEPARVKHLRYPQLARFVRENERGLIRVPSGFAPEVLIHDLAFAYPRQRIIVLGNHVRELDRICQTLATHFPGIQSISSGKPLLLDDHEDMPQIVCSTPYQALDADFATSDIVLLLDAYHCVQERVQVALSEVEARFRLFGIVKTGRKFAPSETDAAAAVFGPEVLDISGSGRSRREANVAWVQTSSRRVDLEPKDSSFWRTCYGHNERRNHLTKQLAETLSAGIELDRHRFCDVATWFDGREYRPQSVTILVDRLVHAMALSKKLPEWTVFTGDVSLDGCPGSFRKRMKRQRRQWMTGQRQIVLADAAQDFRGETTDVVIWAGGGRYIDSIPNSWLSADDGTSKPLLLVDFDDVYNKTARAWSHDRKQGYFDRDVYPPGISAAQGRVAMFLMQQQRRTPQ